METQETANVFARGWQLFRDHPILIVPSLVLGLASAAVTILFAPHPENLGPAPSQAANVFTTLLWWFVGVSGAVLATTYTVGMAQALWTSGSARLSDGWEAVMRDFAGAAVAMVTLLAIGAGAALLGPPTLFVSVIAFAFLTAYVMPAVIVGGLEPFKAFSESFNLAWNYPVNTTVMIVGVAFVWLMALFLNALLSSFVPIAGPIVADVLADAVIAFATLVFVGEYMTIRRVKPRVRS